MEQNPLRKSFLAFTDSVSTGYKVESACGNIIYIILTGSKAAVQGDLVKVIYTQGESLFSIEVTTKSWANESNMILYLRAQLEDYPDAPTLDMPFNLVIEAADTFVFKPPNYEKTEPREDIKPEIVDDEPEPE